MEEKQRNVLRMEKQLWKAMRQIKIDKDKKSYEEVIRFLIQNCKEIEIQKLL